MAGIYSEREVRQVLNHYPQFVKDVILMGLVRNYIDIALQA